MLFRKIESLKTEEKRGGNITYCIVWQCLMAKSAIGDTQSGAGYHIRWEA